MPRSRTTPERAARARRYGRKDAHYQRVLGWWEADRTLCPEAHKQRDKPQKTRVRAGGRRSLPPFSFPTAFLMVERAGEGEGGKKAVFWPKKRVYILPQAHNYAC